MEQNITALLACYRQLINTSESPNPDWVAHFNDLRLVDACLDKVALSRQHPNHPLQIGIIGPTQAGKSTLVNLLTDTDSAGISARAGYTVHAQGFGLGLNESDLEPIHSGLEPMVRVATDELTPDRLNTYVLEPVTAGASALVQNAVVWDSPDFDSIEARGYRGAVLHTLALADALVLMVSKDKYGDKSVWDMLDLMVPLNKPIVIVINKLDERDSNAVQRSFTERFISRFPEASPQPLVTLPYTEDGQSFSNSVLDALQQALDSALKVNSRAQLQPAMDQYVQRHWKQWVEPAEQEHSASAAWTKAVNNTVSEAFTQYESRYLNNDTRNDTFNRALAELLNLLEIPGIAATLKVTREVVTWPVRKLFSVGASVVRLKTAAEPPQPADMERDVLLSVQAHVLIKLQGVVADAQQDFPEQNAWWQALSLELRARRDSIGTAFDQSATQYQIDFEPRIDAAAERLYQQLKKQPALLNSLRAARVTGDAAAVALAVKSGGLAPTDLLVAPAMLSATTLLTESALGRYMTSVKAELKREQSTEVRQQVFEGVLGAALQNLPKSMDQSNLLGLDLTTLDSPKKLPSA